MSLDDWCDTELHDLEAIKSQEQRLYENEQNQTKEKFYNAGYKKGLDWADSNYSDLELCEDKQEAILEAIEKCEHSF